MNFPPPVPMPPQVVNTGPWEDVPFGDSASPGGHGGHDIHDDDLIGIVEPKKPKKKKDDKTPVDIKYEAYSLERASPRHGERLSWARVGKRALPFEDKKLVNIVKQHQNQTRRSAEDDFSRLTSNQQGVINRLILERKQHESNNNAEWVLVDVQRFGKWKSWTTYDVKKLQIVLKRHGKDQMKVGEHTASGGGSNSYHHFDIIDLADPIEDKKKDKKGKKDKSLDDHLDLLDDLGPPPPPHHGNGPPGNHRDPWDQVPGPPPPGPPPPPIDHQFQQGFPPQFPPQFQPGFQPPIHGNGFNPFQPHPQFAAPGQFETPPMNGAEFPHMHRHESARRRSQSRPRQQSARRRSSSAKRRTDKVENWRRDNSSQEDYDEESIWSHGLSEDRSFTPPSSPRSGFSEAMPRGRGSLSRRNSSARPYKYRSDRYRDSEIQPAYTYRDDGRHYSRDAGRYSRRASVHQDDYPAGGAAIPRYIPAPEPPRRPLPRRLTYNNDPYDYNDLDDVRRSRDLADLRRRSTIQYDPLEEAYEAGRRASYRGGGGGYHY